MVQPLTFSLADTSRCRPPMPDAGMPAPVTAGTTRSERQDTMSVRTFDTDYHSEDNRTNPRRKLLPRRCLRPRVGGHDLDNGSCQQEMRAGLSRARGCDRGRRQLDGTAIPRGVPLRAVAQVAPGPGATRPVMRKLRADTAGGRQFRRSASSAARAATRSDTLTVITTAAHSARIYRAIGYATRRSAPQQAHP
jgi:hypothetical protein